MPLCRFAALPKERDLFRPFLLLFGFRTVGALYGATPKQNDVEEIMAVHNALVRAFDVLDDTDIINRCPTLKALAQDIADLADRTKMLSVRH